MLMYQDTHKATALQQFEFLSHRPQFFSWLN